MKIKEASDLLQELANNYPKNLKGAKFNYALIRNQSILKTELAIVEKTFTASEDFITFEEKRIELLKSFCEKDEKGEPIVENEMYKVLPEKASLFEEALKPLKEEYKETLEKREEQVKQFKVLLEEDISFELHKINIKDVPDEITTEQMEVIMPLIVE